MLNLNTTDVIYAKSTVTNVAYFLSGKGIDGRPILKNGFFGSTFFAVYPPPSATFVDLLSFRNIGNTTTLVTVSIGGVGLRNELFKAELESGWSAALDTSGWKVYDTNGRQVITDGSPKITVSSTPPSNPTIGDIWVQI